MLVPTEEIYWRGFSAMPAANPNILNHHRFTISYIAEKLGIGANRTRSQFPIWTA
jgi:hypothetical protein